MMEYDKFKLIIILAFIFCMWLSCSIFGRLEKRDALEHGAFIVNVPMGIESFYVTVESGRITMKAPDGTSLYSGSIDQMIVFHRANGVFIGEPQKVKESTDEH